ncbi:MAG: Asp-tRNA(Asn)/Glu-tRNA(Gln) amidotransferase subunit GatC [Planctomycetota bacterium]
MAITADEVEKVALLARLTLGPDQRDAMTSELAQILGYVEQLGEVDTAGVEPMVHAVETSNIFREDEVGPGLPREAALANAPKPHPTGYLVPAVLGD